MRRRSSAISASIRTSNNGTRRSRSIEWGEAAARGGGISRKPKKSASGVLASLRGSTYRSVRLASSLAAALLDSLFEHPAILRRELRTENSSHTVGFNRVFTQPIRLSESSD